MSEDKIKHNDNSSSKVLWEGTILGEPRIVALPDMVKTYWEGHRPLKMELNQQQMMHQQVRWGYSSVNGIKKPNITYEEFQDALRELCLFKDYNTENSPADVRHIIFENRDVNLEKQRLLAHYFIGKRCCTLSDIMNITLKDYVLFIRKERKKLYSNSCYKESRKKFISKTTFMILDGDNKIKVEESTYGRRTPMALYLINYIVKVGLYKSLVIEFENINPDLIRYSSFLEQCYYDFLFEYMASNDMIIKEG